MPPDPITLRASTGDRTVDTILQGIIAIYEAMFPGRIRSYYLIGSYADWTAVPLSDIDFVVLFGERLQGSEAAAADRLGHACAMLTARRLDVTVSGERDLTWEKSHLKTAGLLVYGDDIRDHLPQPQADAAYVRKWMLYGQRYDMEYLRGVGRLIMPLEYPDPAGEFYGYDTIRVPAAYPPGTARGLKELVKTASVLAAAIVQLQAGRYVATTRESVTLYRAHIGDEWASYLEALYDNARGRWHYLIPATADERQLLRALCGRTLAFENHYFALYRTYLLDMLNAGDEESQRIAVARLGEVIYPDGEVVTAVQASRDRGDGHLREVADATLACIGALCHDAGRR